MGLNVDNTKACLFKYKLNTIVIQVLAEVIYEEQNQQMLNLVLYMGVFERCCYAE